MLCWVMKSTQLQAIPTLVVSSRHLLGEPIISMGDPNQPPLFTGDNSYQIK